MLPSTLELLRAIREAEFLQTQAAATDRQAFLANEVLQRAFVRSVEVIGEAAKKVPDAARAEFPGIEWRKMAGILEKKPDARHLFDQRRNGWPLSHRESVRPPGH
jgi:uncharacterized protein with HEPN domain